MRIEILLQLVSLKAAFFMNFCLWLVLPRNLFCSKGAMPRGDGGWYPIALDCAPFRFPAPNSKTKSHSTFPVENATWLTKITKFDLWEVQRNLVFLFKKIVGTCSNELVLLNYVEIWSSFCELHLLCFYVPRTLCTSTRSMMPWRTEELRALKTRYPGILYLQLTTTEVSFIWHRSCINFWFVGFFLFWEDWEDADFLLKNPRKTHVPS